MTYSPPGCFGPKPKLTAYLLGRNNTCFDDPPIPYPKVRQEQVIGRQPWFINCGYEHYRKLEAEQ